MGQIARGRVLALAVGLTASLLTTTSPAAAHYLDGYRIATLPPGHSQLFLDEPRGRILFRHAGDLHAYGYDGTPKKVLDFGTGASSHVLDPDAETVYVGLDNGDIAVVRLDTLVEIRRLSVGMAWVDSLALTGGFLWVAGRAQSNDEGIYSVNLGELSPRAVLEVLLPDITAVRASPLRPDRLLVVQQMPRWPEFPLSLYDLSSEPASLIARHEYVDDYNAMFVDDGILAGRYLLDADDLDGIHAFGTEPWLGADVLGATPDGRRVALALGLGVTAFFEGDHTQPAWFFTGEHDFGDLHAVTHARDSESMFVVRRDDGTGWSLYRFDSAPSQQSDVTVAVPRAVAGEGLTVTGTVTGGNGSPIANGEVEVWATDLDDASSGHTTRTQTNGAGMFSWQPRGDMATESGYELMVRYFGDPTHRQRTITIEVPVKKAAEVTLATLPAVVKYRTPIAVTASTMAPGDLVLSAHVHGEPAKNLIKRTPPAATVTATVAPERSTTFHAHYAGADDYWPATQTRRVAVRAKVTGALKGYRGAERLGRLYATYKPHATVTFTGGVLPNKAGASYQLKLQRLVGNQWTEVSQRSMRLSAGSSVAATWSANRFVHAARYRLCGSYAGDRSNLGALAPCRYFTVKG